MNESRRAPRRVEGGAADESALVQGVQALQLQPAVAEPAGVRFTDLLCTINTNRAATSPDEEDRYIASFKEFLSTDLLTKKTLIDPRNELLKFQEGPAARVFHSLRVPAHQIEVGSVRHFIHYHGQFELRHFCTLVLSGMQKRWQEYIDLHLPWVTGSNVDLTLLQSSAAKNYALKHQQ